MVDVRRVAKVLTFLGSLALLTMVVPISQLNAAQDVNTGLSRTLVALLEKVERVQERTCATDLVGPVAIAAELRRAHPAVVEAIKTLQVEARKQDALVTAGVKEGKELALAGSDAVSEPELLNLSGDDESAEKALRKSHPELVRTIEEAWAPYNYAKIWGDRQIVTKEIHGIQGKFRQQEGKQDRYAGDLLKGMKQRDDMAERYLKHRHDKFPALYERLRGISRDNTVILMAFNYGEVNIFANWLCSCKRSNIDVSHLLVVATDEKLHRFLDHIGVVNVYAPEIFGAQSETAATSFGDDNWHPFGQLKMQVPKMLFDGGFNVLFQDVDMVWFKDPLEDMKRNASLDYFDARFQYVGFPRDVFSPFNANSGYFYMKNNSYSRTCWDNMFYAQEKVGAWTNSQQLALNHYLGLCAGAEHLRVMTLPREQYPSGWVQLDKKMNEVLTHREELVQLADLTAAGTLEEHRSELTAWQRDFVADRKKRDMEEYYRLAREMVLYHLNWTKNPAAKITKATLYRVWFLPGVTESTELAGLLPNPPTMDALLGLCKDPAVEAT